MKIREALRKLRRSGWQRIRKSATSHAIWQRGKDRLIISESDPLCTTSIKKIKAAIE
ncbi:MAG: hypothetical protein MUC48_22145 [Leptolyngbya sp. Prado105]|jgi:predicted RNA binding protein YcfA (HicA-like mRNA interferase family)|nr:hypothetical protein [Leptolyngbya sp. Prado105]